MGVLNFVLGERRRGGWGGEVKKIFPLFFCEIAMHPTLKRQKLRQQPAATAAATAAAAVALAKT